MADDVDIDAMVLKARAQAREFNETLDKLERAGVAVSVIQRPGQGEMNYAADISRVTLGLVFHPQRSLYASGANQAQDGARMAPTITEVERRIVLQCIAARTP